MSQALPVTESPALAPSPPPTIAPLFPNWPAPKDPITRPALAGAVAVGLAGALIMPWTTPGIGWLATGLVGLVALWLGYRPLATPVRTMWTVAALVSLAVLGAGAKLPAPLNVPVVSTLPAPSTAIPVP